MITLALAQMVYFFCLQAPFTGGEDGIQAVPRGKLLGLLPLNGLAMYYTVLGRLRGGIPAHPPRHPFAFRPGAQGDPRERAARRLARLPHRALQARRVHHVGGALGARRGDQGDRLPARVPHRRALDDVRRGGPHDARWGPGHGLRARSVGAFVLVAMENYLSQIGAWVTIAQGAIFVAACSRSAAASWASSRRGCGGGVTGDEGAPSAGTAPTTRPSRRSIS